MFFKRYRALLILGIVLATFIILIIFFQQIKREELYNQLTKIELKDVRIGAGVSNGVLGTAIFGEIQNNGDKIVSIAEMKVEFINREKFVYFCNFTVLVQKFNIHFSNSYNFFSLIINLSKNCCSKDPIRCPYSYPYILKLNLC